MIISHEHKFVFLRTYKTGSTSAEQMIVESGILGGQDYSVGFDDNVTHSTADDLLVTGRIDQHIIDNYLFVMTVRHPVDRFLSSFFYHCFINKKTANLEHLKALIHTQSNLGGYIGRPQSHYFRNGSENLNHVLAVDITNLNDGIEAFIESFGGTVKQPHELKKISLPMWANKDYETYLSESDICILFKKLESELTAYYQIKKLGKNNG